MVRTAASVFSPDEGGPLKRRVRQRYATAETTYHSLVNKVTIPGPFSVTLYWHFTQKVTQTSSPIVELKVAGETPIQTWQHGVKIIRCEYPVLLSFSGPWRLDSTPPNLTVDPPLKIPQAGIVILE